MEDKPHMRARARVLLLAKWVLVACLLVVLNAPAAFSNHNPVTGDGSCLAHESTYFCKDFVGDPEVPLDLDANGHPKDVVLVQVSEGVCESVVRVECVRGAS
jgi:hypothetical protein